MKSLTLALVGILGILLVVGAEAATPSRRVFLPLVPFDATPTPTPRPTMIVGTNIIDRNYELVQEMGFPWVKLYVDWNGADPENEVTIAHQRYTGVKILMRIDKSPPGARTGDDANPIDAAQLSAFLRNLVPRMRGRVHAYELFNEPNLKWEWNTNIAGGSGMPSAAGYARVLAAAYTAIKQSDPNAIVVSGGVSPAGNGGSEAIGDLIFIQRLYDAGARSSVDAIGIHPYGGPFAWNQGMGDPTGIYFRRSEEARAVALANGDSDRKFWATEMGWLVDPRVYGYATYAGRDCLAGLGGRIAWVRQPDDVAQQLKSSYQHAADNWPWMGGMFFFNFDYSAAGWVNTYDKVCDAPNWYSIVSRSNEAGRPAQEPAFAALQTFARGYLSR